MAQDMAESLSLRYDRYCTAFDALRARVETMSAADRKGLTAKDFKELRATWDAFFHGTPVDGGHMEDGLLSATGEQLKPLLTRMNAQLPDAAIEGPGDLRLFLQGHAQDFKSLVKKAEKFGLVLGNLRLDVPGLFFKLRHRRFCTAVRGAVHEMTATPMAAPAPPAPTTAPEPAGPTPTVSETSPQQQPASLMKNLVHNGERPRYLVLAGGAAVLGALAWKLTQSQEEAPADGHAARIRQAQEAGPAPLEKS